MLFGNRSEEFIDEPSKKKNKKPRKKINFKVKSIIDGTLFQKHILDNITFVLFVFIILILFIANRFHAEKTVRNINTVEKELKELRVESISISSELVSISRQSEVSKLVKSKGLKLEEATEPPLKVVVED